MADTLPEGTDRITTGPSDEADARGAKDRLRGEAGEIKARAQAKVGEYRAMALDQARDVAGQGKDKAMGALEGVARLIDDNATQIDERLGTQYGDYARRASAFVTDAADGLRGRDVDALLDEARAFVRRAPGVAIAAATAAGFLAARVVKAGAEHSASESAPTPTPTAKPRARRATPRG